jgi:hypothetical protein
MTDINIVFSRALLLQAHAEVKKHFPQTNLRSGAWTYHFVRDNWEFHGPDQFYWHGSASNAYEARYKGWMAWLRHKGINLDEAA